MPANYLEASVRLKPGGTVLDLRGEINGFAQQALNAAYTEAEAKDPGGHHPQLRGVDFIDSAGIVLLGHLLAKARLEASPSGLQPGRPLPRFVTGFVTNRRR